MLSSKSILYFAIILLSFINSYSYLNKRACSEYTTCTSCLNGTSCFWCSQAEICTDSPQNCTQCKIAWITEKVKWECPSYLQKLQQCPNVSLSLITDDPKWTYSSTNLIDPIRAYTFFTLYSKPPTLAIHGLDDKNDFVQYINSELIFGMYFYEESSKTYNSSFVVDTSLHKATIDPDKKTIAFIDLHVNGNGYYKMGFAAYRKDMNECVFKKSVKELYIYPGYLKSLPLHVGGFVWLIFWTIILSICAKYCTFEEYSDEDEIYARKKRKLSCKWFCCMSNEELVRVGGTPAYFYTRFSWMILFCFIADMILCIAVILPVDLTDSTYSNMFPDLSTLSLANIANGSTRAWAHFAIGVLFFAVIRGALIGAILKFGTSLKQIAVSQYSRYAVRISDVNVSENKIKRHFKKKFGKDAVLAVSGAYDLGEIPSLMASKKEIEKAMVEYKDKKAYKYLCFERDLNKELEEVTNKINERRTKPFPFTGIVFVVFRNPKDTFKVIHDYSSKNKRRRQAEEYGLEDVKNWKVQRAPEPDDILWENLKYSRMNRVVRFILLNGLLFYTLSLTAFLLTFYSFIELGWFYFETQEKIVPYLISGFNNLIIYPIIRLVAYFEKHQTYVGLAREDVYKSSMLLLIMTIFAPFGAPIATSLFKVYLEPNSASMTSHKFFQRVGSTLIQFIFIDAFLSKGLSMGLVFLKMCYQKFRYNKCYRVPADHTFEFARVLSIFALVSMYAPYFPLIIIPAIIYMLCVLFIDNWIVMVLYQKGRRSDGRIMYRVLMLIGTCSALMPIFQWFVMAVKAGTWPVQITMIAIVPLYIIFLIIGCILVMRRRKTKAKRSVRKKQKKYWGTPLEKDESGESIEIEKMVNEVVQGYTQPYVDVIHTDLELDEIEEKRLVNDGKVDLFPPPPPKDFVKTNLLQGKRGHFRKESSLSTVSDLELNDQV